MRKIRRNYLIPVITCAILVMCMMFSSTKAYADLIWEPEDSFYEHHSSECHYVDRTFAANPPEGESLEIFEAPDSAKVIATREKGEYIGISHSYKDSAGNSWGLLYAGGWVPMDYLAELYDGEAFYKEYSDEITRESGEIDISQIPEDKDMYFYSYPGAEEGYSVYKQDDNPYYSMCFTDPEGHKWGYVSYYYISEGWVCIDAPDATFDELYPNGQNFSGDLGEIKAPEKRVTPIPGPFGGIPVPLIVGAVVGVIVVVTAVILIVVSVNIKKKKKSKQN